MIKTRTVEAAPGTFGQFGRILEVVDRAEEPRPFVVICEATVPCWLTKGQDEATLLDARVVARTHIESQPTHRVRIEDATDRPA